MLQEMPLAVQLTHKMFIPPPKEFLSRYINLSKSQKSRYKKIIHKPTNKGQSLKHNKIGLVLQEMVEKL
jgi:hypothetical protein